MAYFSNGTEGAMYEEMYCVRCVHYGDGTECPVLQLHAAWNYEAVGKDKDETKEEALDTLWPRAGAHNGECAMFFESE